MTETRLLIARHGETDYNKKGLLQGRGIDAPLNEQGRSQARCLAGYLVNYNTTGIAVSSLQRTWQTADPYRVQTQLELLKNRDLDEMDFGDFEGADQTVVAGELNRLQNTWKNGDTAVKIPGGESPKEVFKRANDAVRTIIKSYGGGTIVFVLHGRLIRILLSQWLGFGLQNMHKIKHQNCAVNHLVFSNNEFKPVYLNKISHL